jgi:hypothetical protein
MTAKIQIKFSKAIRGEGEGESVEYDILSRRGSSEWRVVGTAEAQMAVSYDGNWCQPNQYRIGDIVADLWVEADGNDWMTFEVEVGYLPRRGQEWRQLVTVAEAKRTIKTWAAEQLSNSNLKWSGTGPRP